MKFEFYFKGKMRTFLVRGYVDLMEFREELSRQISPKDPVLEAEAIHCWMRLCPDSEGRFMLVKAVPESRGSFKATLIQAKASCNR